MANELGNTNLEHATVSVSSGNADLAVAGPAETNRGITLRTVGDARWRLIAGAVAESGSNQGSDFVLARFSDTPAFIDNPVTVSRATGNVTLAQDLTVTGDLTVGTDKSWTRFVGAKEMIGGTSAPALSLLSLQADNVHVPVLSFDQTTAEYAGFALGLPDGYDGSALNFRYYWTATGAITGSVIWAAEVAVFANDNTMTVSPTVATVTDAWMANKDCHIVDKSITPNGATAGDTLLSVYLYRDTSDTLDADAHLIGVRIGYA